MGRKRHSECLPLSVWCFWLWCTVSQLPISRQTFPWDYFRLARHPTSIRRLEASIKLLATYGDRVPRCTQSEILNHPNVTAAGHTLDCQFAAVWSGDRPGSPRSALVPERSGTAIQVHMEEG